MMLPASWPVLSHGFAGEKDAEDVDLKRSQSLPASASQKLKRSDTALSAGIWAIQTSVHDMHLLCVMSSGPRATERYSCLQGGLCKEPEKEQKGPKAHRLWGCQERGTQRPYLARRAPMRPTGAA